MARGARRVVTGHDENGKSIFLSDGPPPNTLEKGTDIDFYEMWRTSQTPAMVSAVEPEPTYDHIVTGPVPGGVNFRCIDLLPGHVKKWKARKEGAHPGMHRTESIDYCIVVEGEIALVLDDSEVILKQGEVAIQRGTDHAWENRTSKITRMAFILVDGQFTPELRATLPETMALGGVPNLEGAGTE